MNAHLDTIETPIGNVVFATNNKGDLLGLKFTDGLHSLTLEEELEQDGLDHWRYVGDGTREYAPTARSRREILDYFTGDRSVFDVSLVLRGSEFQKAVWMELLRIPLGETRTYAEVAESIGRPGAG